MSLSDAELDRLLRLDPSLLGRESAARWLSIGRDVRRGAESLDRLWPGWWYETIPLRISWRRCVIALAAAQGCRWLNSHRSREYGFDYFFQDENEMALKHYSRLVNDRRLWERRAEYLGRLADLYERDLLL